MPRVAFYVIQDGSPDDRLRLACKLTDKAYHLGHRIYIQAQSAEQARRLDDLLWTFRAGSFLPHALAPQAEPSDHPILIGVDAEPPAEAAAAQVLINLSDQVPPFYARFERVAEIPGIDEAGRRAGRERFKFYRDQGCALETHTLAQVP
jgi:DNA polymerase-3 subunit chi